MGYFVISSFCALRVHRSTYIAQEHKMSTRTEYTQYEYTVYTENILLIRVVYEARARTRTRITWYTYNTVRVYE